MRRQQGKCCYCNERMRNYGPNNGNRATIEHIHPRALGGTDDESNLKLACAVCNANRGKLLGNQLNHFRKKAEVELQMAAEDVRE